MYAAGFTWKLFREWFLWTYFNPPNPHEKKSLKTNEHKYNFCLHISVCHIAASLSYVLISWVNLGKGRKVQGEDEPSLSQGLTLLLHSSLGVGELGNQTV